ncbi:MAG: SPOR domain-containing protein [Phycisphaeraceae bacterium]
MNQRSCQRGPRVRSLLLGARRLGVCMLLLVAGLVGCQTTGPVGDEGSMTDYGTLYEQRQYRQAYEAASAVAQRRGAGDRDAAAYVAGLSAMRLGRTGEAERHLRQAALSRDERLQADALANLGLLQYRLGRYDAAARDLSRAAEMLGGEDKAQAHYYAGVARQRLGRWPQARTSLLLARHATRDEGLRQRINDQLAVTGYTVQVGAFAERDNARRAAEAIAGRAGELRFGGPRLVSARAAEGESLTLVHVGTFSSFQAAHDARVRLRATRAIIVPLAGR